MTNIKNKGATKKLDSLNRPLGRYDCRGNLSVHTSQ